MGDTYWKSFKLGELFEWNSKHKISKTAKQYDTSSTYLEGYVANVTAGMYNEGIASYIPEDEEIKLKKKINCLTISSNGAGVGACFYHNYYFVSTGDNALLENKVPNLQKIFNSNDVVPFFFAKHITKLFINGIFSWSYKVSKDDFNREIILLPCIEVTEDDEYIWEEYDDISETYNYYKLDVDEITKLMDKAVKIKEERTIKEYESMKELYVTEKELYDTDEEFQKKLKKYFWKSFELGELFDRNNKHKITDAIKLLNMSNNKDEVFTIANITASKENNGCAGYLEETDEIKNKKKKNYLTIGSDASTFCFYHDYEFITTGHNNLLEVKNSTLKKDLDTHPEAYRFLAKLISKTLMLPGINRFSRGISSDFDRELVLLPVIHNEETEEEIQTDIMAYLYLKGRILNCDNKIKNYEELIKTSKYNIL